MRIKFLVIVSILIGLVVRLYLLFTLPKWIDEVFTDTILSKSFRLIANGQLDPTHPPVYYLLLKLWSLVDTSLAWLRFSNILFFITNCFLLYKIGIKLINKRYSFFLLISYVLSGYAIIFDWQIRSYAGLSTFILGSLYVLTLYPTKKIRLIFFVLTLLGLFFDYGYLWYIGSLIMFLSYNMFFLAKKEYGNNFSLYLLPSVSALCLFLLIWFLFARNYFFQGLEGIHWIGFYTSPIFFVPFFLGAAHGVQIFSFMLFFLFIIGFLFLMKMEKKVFLYYLVISSAVMLEIAFSISILVAPILHVRSLQIIGILVMFMYANCFYWLSQRKIVVFIALALYISNFLLIVNSIFITPGRLLLKF